jgi:hypothetical protein
MSEQKTEPNRLADIVNLPNNGDQSAPTPIILGNGVVARLEGEIVRITNDEAELFRFPSTACPFNKEPLSFLLQVYSIGYQRGRNIGRELVKIRIRELLGTEL